MSYYSSAKINQQNYFMRRRALSVLFLVALMSLLWFVFGLEQRALLIGVHPWIGYETLYLAREFGWLPGQVALREGNTAADSLAGLQAGVLDGAALTLDEVLWARAAGVPLTVVAVFNVSAGADVVLAKPDLRTLADLRGRRIAVEHSTVGELMLNRLLQAAGLAAGEVVLVDVPPVRQLAAWRAGAVDALVTYEPTASLLKREGAIPLFDSRRIPETIFDVLAVRRDRLWWRRAAVRTLLAAHFQGLDHLRVSRQDAIYRIATRQRVSADDIQRALAGITLPSPSGNRGYLAPDSRLELAARALNEIMVATGRLPRPDSLQDLFDPAYLPSEQTPGP